MKKSDEFADNLHRPLLVGHVSGKIPQQTKGPSRQTGDALRVGGQLRSLGAMDYRMAVYCQGRGPLLNKTKVCY